ncbi:MAG TPA: hypothetical protein VF745_17125, partial [Steroidobacteraceae bacterium]
MVALAVPERRRSAPIASAAASAPAARLTINQFPTRANGVSPALGVTEDRSTYCLKGGADARI